MSDTPTSLRNIPADALQMAQAVSKSRGISVSDVLRMAMTSGTIIELINTGPDRQGQYAGYDLPYLANVLRRQLAAVIDFLLEQGQHPYQGLTVGAALPVSTSDKTPAPIQGMMFDAALEDELEGLGLGGGLADMLMEPAV